MEAQFSWKTKLFSNRFEISRNNVIAGELKKEGWSRKVHGELNGRKVLFETKGVFKHETKIIDMVDNSTIGRIEFHNWKAKATVFYQNKEYQWQYDNFFRSKWSLNNENGVLIKFQSHAFKGNIIAYTKDEILILTGFFIRNFIKQKSAEIAAAT
jgi:hypothetical protein